jgi:hypothetical protein
MTVKAFASIVIGTAIAAAAVPVAAQSAPTPAAAQRLRDANEQLANRQAANLRYEIGQMERVLEGAVEHGVTVTRDRLQAIAQVPAEMLVSDNAHARGFRLDGYGVFFDVVVPSFETTLTWTLRTLDQNDLGLDSALRALQTHVKTSGDPNLEQALKRIELQVNPAVLARTTVPEIPDARNATGSAALAAETPAATSTDDPIMADPGEAYRSEVVQALKDAMLAHSSALRIGAGEWLTIAAKGNEDRPRLAPADSDARTRIIRLRGSDLADFLAGRITREEALQRIEVRVF